MLEKNGHSLIFYICAFQNIFTERQRFCWNDKGFLNKELQILLQKEQEQTTDQTQNEILSGILKAFDQAEKRESRSKGKSCNYRKNYSLERRNQSNSNISGYRGESGKTNFHFNLVCEMMVII